MTFQTDVCEAYGCDKTEYCKVVLYKCLYPYAVPFAKIVSLIHPGFFWDDYDLLIKISNAESPDEVVSILEDYLYKSPPRGFLRGFLKIRISPEKLIGFALDVMKKPY